MRWAPAVERLDDLRVVHVLVPVDAIERRHVLRPAVGEQAQPAGNAFAELLDERGGCLSVAAPDGV